MEDSVQQNKSSTWQRWIQIPWFPTGSSHVRWYICRSAECIHVVEFFFLPFAGQQRSWARAGSKTPKNHFSPKLQRYPTVSMSTLGACTLNLSTFNETSSNKNMQTSQRMRISATLWQIIRNHNTGCCWHFLVRDFALYLEAKLFTISSMPKDTSGL